jgi:hypothetical protein
MVDQEMNRTKQDIRERLEAKLVQVIARSHEGFVQFDLASPVVSNGDLMDSLDLAEVFAWIEQQYEVCPLQEGGLNGVRWEDLVSMVDAQIKDHGGGCGSASS